MSAIFEQLGTPLHVHDSGEALDRGHTVELDSSLDTWKKAACGEGTGLSMQTAQQLSTGTDIYSTSWSGYRNWYRPSLTNVGDRLAVDTGPFVASHFDRFTGAVTQNDLLYCVGSGILGSYTTASAASGWSTSSQMAVAKALSSGTRVGGSGTATIRIVGVFSPRKTIT
jgi:hypothetical protein